MHKSKCRKSLHRAERCAMGTSPILGLNPLPSPVNGNTLEDYSQVQRSAGTAKMGGPNRKQEEKKLRKTAPGSSEVITEADEPIDPRDSANALLSESEAESNAYRGTQISIYV